MYGVERNVFFYIRRNISGENGFMGDGKRYKNWIVNENRYGINVYIGSI